MTLNDFPYLHGFSANEQERLRKQARLFEPAIFHDIDFRNSRHILEVGSGVGAQSEILLRRFPELRVTGIDLNERQLAAANAHLAQMPWLQERVEFQRANATDLPFEPRSFDGAFLCWVLEHVPSPARALAEVRRVLDSFGTPHTHPTARGIGHIFNLGHGISQFTPPEHVTHLVDEVHQHSRRLRAMS